MYVKHLPQCPDDVMLALLEHGVSCLSIYYVNLVCDDDKVMVKMDQGYVCVDDGKVPMTCGVHEVVNNSPHGFQTCISLDDASELCGDEFVAVKDEMSFVCKKLHVRLECPDGLELVMGKGIPVCASRNGGVRPCDLPADVLMRGCVPECANGGTCMGTTCICPPGITGHACHVDVDECIYDTDCEHGCMNTFGSYKCTCPTRMHLHTDGMSCIEDACIPTCLNGGVCGQGRCDCPRGLYGDHCQTDEDECLKYGDRLCQYRCRNTYGSYQCQCPPGSILNSDGRTCTNTTCIAECKNGGSCLNNKCICQAGFYGIICQFDINECRTGHDCGQVCINTWGSYRCSCERGYVIGADRRSCRSR